MAAIPGGGAEHKTRYSSSIDPHSSSSSSSRYEGFGSDDLEIAEQIAFAEAASKRAKVSPPSSGDITSSSNNSNTSTGGGTTISTAATVATPSTATPTAVPTSSSNHTTTSAAIQPSPPINTRIPIIWTCNASSSPPSSSSVSTKPERVDVIVCDPSNNARIMTGVPFCNVTVGNVVMIRKMQHSPADIIVIASSEPNDECYIHTACFDGNKSMLMRQAMPLPVPLSLRDIKDIPINNGDHHHILVDHLVTQLRTTNPSSWLFMAASPTKKTDDIHIATCRVDRKSDTNSTDDNGNSNSNSNGNDVTIIRQADYKYFIPHQAQIFMCDWVIGIAIYTSPHTKFALNDAWDGAKRKEEEKKREEKEKKEKLESERRAKDALKPSASERAVLFERSTKICWESKWTDVPDDGNCMLTAFFLGLTALIKHYPSVSGAGDKSLPNTAEEFRQDLFNRLRNDHLYKQSMRNQFDVYFTMDEGFLIGMEDFYTLPEHIRERILVAKRQLAGGTSGGVPTSEWQCDACTTFNIAGDRQCLICGTPYSAPAAATPASTGSPAPKHAAPDLDSYVSSYIDAVTTPTLIAGRRVYVPLGQAEISALSRLYDVKLQTMSSDGVLKSQAAVTLEEIDPRTIESRDIQDWIPESQHIHAHGDGHSHGSSDIPPQRIVRLLNVKRNHYYVHLPCACTRVSMEQQRVAAAIAYNDATFWRRPDITTDLPPL